MDRDGPKHDVANHQVAGGCRMCLAIPGKIVEISSDNPDSALVDVVGVRRRIDLGLLTTSPRRASGYSFMWVSP